VCWDLTAAAPDGLRPDGRIRRDTCALPFRPFQPNAHRAWECGGGVERAGEEALEAAAVAAERVAGVVAGLAGVGDFNVREEMRSNYKHFFLVRRWPFARIWISLWSPPERVPWL